MIMESKLKNFSVVKKIVLAISLLGVFASLPFLIPNFRFSFIELLEKLFNKTATENWNLKFLFFGICSLFFFSVVLIFVCLQSQFEKALAILFDSMGKLFLKNSNFVLSIAFLTFIISNIILIRFHEAWRDEAQAWLIAKYSSPKGLLSILPNEGHPALWFLILMPFAKSGLPFEWISYLSLTMTSIAAIIFLKEFKLPPVIKIIALFSPIFFYFSPVIARSYCLITLELICVGAFYSRRKQNPILWGTLCMAMLQTHIYLAGFSGALLLQMLFEFINEREKKSRRKIFIGGIIGGVGVALLFLEFAGNSGHRDAMLSHFLSSNFLFTLAYSVFRICFTAPISNCGIFFGMIFTIPFFFIIKEQAQKNWQEFFIFTLTFLHLIFVISVYPALHFQHEAAIFSMFFVFLFIFPQSKSKILNSFFCLFLLLSCGRSFSYAMKDMKVPFSNSKAMAQYLKNNISKNAIIVTEKDRSRLSSLAAYLNGAPKIVFPNGNEYRFTVWDSRTNNKSWKEYDQDSSDEIFYLFPEELYEGDELELLHSENLNNLRKENYFIYKKRE